MGNNTQRTNPAVTNQFDALNRLTNMVDGVGTTAFTYTAAGDLASEVGPWSNSTLTSTYDSSVPHLRVGLSLQQPSGSWTNGFGYDAVKRLQSVVSPAGTHTYTYNGPGNIWTNLALPPTASHVGRTLDSVARLTSTALVSYWGTNLNYHGYTNNAAGQRIAQVRTDGSYVAYGYDNDGQLQSAVGSGGQSTENLGYQYDACQNLNTRTNGGTPTSFTVDTLNELSGGPTSPYGYDSNGNQTSTNNCTYGYDGADRMTSITSGTAYQTLFTYDGLGRLRIRQDNTWNGSSWVMSGQTWYLYDGRRIIHPVRYAGVGRVAWTPTASAVIDRRIDGALSHGVKERDGTNTPQVSYTHGTDLGGGLKRGRKGVEKGSEKGSVPSIDN